MLCFVVRGLVAGGQIKEDLGCSEGSLAPADAGVSLSSSQSGRSNTATGNAAGKVTP